MKNKRIWLGLVWWLLAMSPLTLSAAAFEEGKNYQRIIPEQPTETGNKVEVVELFWYGCPHCHRFQTYVDRWMKTKPADAEWRYMPAIFRDDWAIGARAFYTAEALGVGAKIHQPLFDAIHAEKRRMDGEDALAAFFVEQGVKEDLFRKTYNSFAVDAKVRRAKDMTTRYRANSTPSVIVNGKYRVDPEMAGGNFATMLKIVDFLIEKERKGKS